MGGIVPKGHYQKLNFNVYKMAKNSQVGNKKVLVVFGILSLVAVVFFSSTDTFQLFSVATLSLDATSSKSSASDRGVQASTGHFTGEAKLLQKAEKDKFKEPKAPKIPQCTSPNNPKCQVNPIPLPLPVPRPTLPPINCTSLTCEDVPQQVVVIDTRDGSTRTENVVDSITGGGGVASSTVGQAGGFQQVIRDEVTIHDRFHTPANGQTTTGTLLVDWGHRNPVRVTQFLVPNEFFDWFEVDLPQDLRGEGISFDGISSDEFKYKLTIPEDLIDKTNVIPVRLIIESQTFTVDGLAEIQIERPTEESTTFSFAEFIRSILAGFRT